MTKVAVITAGVSGMGAGGAERLAAFTKLFAGSHAAQNMRMNNVLPGFIDSLPEAPEFKGRIPMERYGMTEEIAAIIAFLASVGAGYITGQNIRVDGGITGSI